MFSGERFFEQLRFDLDDEYTDCIIMKSFNQLLKIVDK